jgi:hypothetical protein
MAILLVSASIFLVFGLVAYYLSILIRNNKKTPQEAGLKALLSVHCHVRSDSMVGFSSGKDFYSTLPARFTLYQQFIVIKAITDQTYQRDHVVFVQRPGLFGQRLFIKLGELGNAIEIIGKTAKIIPALKHAGYQVVNEK